MLRTTLILTCLLGHATFANPPLPTTRPVAAETKNAFARATLLFETSRFSDALVLLKKEIHGRPHHVRAYLYAAMCAEGMRDFATAADYWRDYGLLAATSAERTRARLRRNYCLRKSGHAAALPAPARLKLPALEPLNLSEEQIRKLSVYEQQAVTVRNENFTVTAHNRALAELIAKRCKLHLRQISAFLLGGRLWPHTTEIVVYKNHKTYLATGGVPHWSGGGFRFRRDPDGTAIRRVDVYQFDARGRFQTTLLSIVLPHELCHVVTTEYFGDRQPPLWLNEGLAMLAEDVDALWRQRPLIGPLQEKTTPSWRWLFNQQKVERGHVGRFYAMAASVTRFLAEHLEATQFQTFLAEIKGGQDSLSALSRALGADQPGRLAALEDVWRQKTLRKLLKTADERSMSTARTTSRPADAP